MLKLKETLPKCKREVNGRHFFEKVGIWKEDRILHTCSHCGKSVYEGISPLVRNKRLRE